MDLVNQLLNILGGLDTYDQGDLLINGVSTKTFKEKDWYAYRNTYTGLFFRNITYLKIIMLKIILNYL